MQRSFFWSTMLFYFVNGQNRFFPLDDCSDEGPFADILSEVLKTSRSRDALLILRDSPLDGQANDILGKVSATTTRHVPTLYVNTDRINPEFQVSSCAVSRDLVVYIYVSEQEPDILEGKLIAEDISRFIHERVRPKVLVLMILRQPCRDLAALFRAMWSKKILDATIVEYSRTKCLNEYPTIVNWYNPFIDTVTKKLYSADVIWFTDSFPDMQGYPLVYAIGRRPPYCDILPNSTGQAQKLEGVDQMVIGTLAEKINFTAVPKIITEYVYIKTMPDGSQYGIMPNVSSGKYDAVLNTVPMLLYPLYPHVQFTDAIVVENWCFVVPRLFVERILLRGTVALLFLASISIVGLFWVCSRLMNFNPGRWHPLKILGIMLATSFPPEPRKMHERIIYLSVFAACARYSSTLFAELTSTNLQSDYYARFDHLEDLINSDLVLMMHMDILDIITQDNSVLDRFVHQSRKKIMNITLMETCLQGLLRYQNVSCFIEQGWANLAAVNNMRDGETMLKTTKLCYLSPPSGSIFPKGSPYVRRVSDLFLMLAEGGIRDKWHRDYLRNKTRETTIEMNRGSKDSMYVNVFHPLLYALILGYSISTIVFIGELICKHFDLNWNICLFP